MTKLIVDIPDPKDKYDTSTQRQINRMNQGLPRFPKV